MRLPRNVSGADLVHRLEVFGYRSTRQRGSHVRLTTQLDGEHHITIPLSNPLRLGTLAGILSEVAGHFGMSRDDVAEQLFRQGN